MTFDPDGMGLAAAALSLVREITSMCSAVVAESLRLARKVSLLIHLLEEIRDFAARISNQEAPKSPPPASPWPSVADLFLALEAVKKFLLLSAWHNVSGRFNQESVSKKLEIQFQYVTWQLDKVLSNISYDQLEISDEVQEEVELVLAQLRREIVKNGAENLTVFEELHSILFSTNAKGLKRTHSFKFQAALNDSSGSVDLELKQIVIYIADVNGKFIYDAERMTLNLMNRLKRSNLSDLPRTVSGIRSTDLVSSTVDDSKSHSIMIPEDFLCPISLERMRDPVVVSTGQTYERSFIQRWIDCGNQTCPKTRQKLNNLTLTPNYVLRSLITQWCEANKIEHPHRSTSGLRSSNTLGKVTREKSLINALVYKLNSSSRDEQRLAAAGLRSLAKKSGNRILIAEAGAIPTLVSLLLVDDKKMQEHAVTSLLNLSIDDHNKEAIMLAGAIQPIIQVLRDGSMEARENASTAIFSLSLTDENKVTIGGTPGAIEALVELLGSGSLRGKKDAATALFNLCIYEGNISRAVSAGILGPLVKILKDSLASGMVVEVLSIFSVLVRHLEGKMALSKATTISLLIDLLRTGQPLNRENAASILLTLCKKNCKNLACIGRMGAVIPLTDIAKTGTERAKRKAIALLDQLQKLQIL